LRLPAGELDVLANDLGDAAVHAIPRDRGQQVQQVVPGDEHAGVGRDQRLYVGSQRARELFDQLRPKILTVAPESVQVAEQKSVNYHSQESGFFLLGNAAAAAGPFLNHRSGRTCHGRHRVEVLVLCQIRRRRPVATWHERRYRPRTADIKQALLTNG
jgi:hypothetical protein